MSGSRGQPWGSQSPSWCSKNPQGQGGIRSLLEHILGMVVTACFSQRFDQGAGGSGVAQGSDLRGSGLLAIFLGERRLSSKVTLATGRLGATSLGVTGPLVLHPILGSQPPGPAPPVAPAVLRSPRSRSHH